MNRLPLAAMERLLGTFYNQTAEAAARGDVSFCIIKSTSAPAEAAPIDHVNFPYLASSIGIRMDSTGNQPIPYRIFPTTAHEEPPDLLGEWPAGGRAADSLLLWSDYPTATHEQHQSLPTPYQP
ncbi:MAG: hypothetical protein ACLGQW_08310 [Acidobacteriota bacterium]